MNKKESTTHGSAIGKNGINLAYFSEKELDSR